MVFSNVIHQGILPVTSIKAWFPRLFYYGASGALSIGWVRVVVKIRIKKYRFGFFKNQ
jgi:hypothetical protein